MQQPSTAAALTTVAHKHDMVLVGQQKVKQVAEPGRFHSRNKQ